MWEWSRKDVILSSYCQLLDRRIGNVIGDNRFVPCWEFVVPFFLFLLFFQDRREEGRVDVDLDTFYKYSSVGSKFDLNVVLL